MDLNVLLLFTVIFIAATVQGILGFGFGMISIPVLVTFLPPQMLIPIIIALATILNTTLMIQHRHDIQLRRITPLIIGGILGFPLGPMILKFVPAAPLKITIGVIIFATTLALATGFKIHFKKEKKAMIPIGLLSSILGGSIGIGGPPIVLFLTNQGDNPEIFRANSLTFFCITSWLILPTLWSQGLVTITTLQMAGLGLPAMAIGGGLGCLLNHKVSHRWFKWMTLGLIFLASTSLVIGTLTN